MYTTGYHYSRALRIFTHTHTLPYQTLSLHYILTYLHPDIVRIMSSMILTPTYQRIMDLAVHIYGHTIDIHGINAHMHTLAWLGEETRRLASKINESHAGTCWHMLAHAGTCARSRTHTHTKEWKFL
jgi:hypothetical protein